MEACFQRGIKNGMVIVWELFNHKSEKNIYKIKIAITFCIFSSMTKKGIHINLYKFPLYIS